MPAASTHTVNLRALEQADLSAVRAWHNSPSVRDATFSFPFPASVEGEQAWYERNVVAGDGRNAIFGIAPEAATDAIIGLAMLRNIDWISRNAWFGLFIGAEDARGRGYGSQACKLTLDFGFRNLGLNRISLEVAATNEAAIRLYQRAGFQVEGLLRQARFVAGDFIDVRLMAILAHDFGALS